MPNEHLEPRTVTLFDQLAEALKGYKSGGVGRRTVAIQALSAINAYLREFEVAKIAGLQLPFVDLATALVELDDGIVSDLFEARRPAGQRREDLFQRLVRVQAAATMELLMRAGMRSDQAASCVARSLNGVGYRHVKNQSVSPATIRYWREKVRRVRGEDRDDFYRLIKRWEPLIASHPEGLLDKLITLLRQTAGARGRIPL